MKKKLFWFVAIILVLTGAYFYKSRLKPASEENNGKQEQKSSDQQNKNSNAQTTGNTLEGVLKASNDRGRGNLMLELSDSDRVIYMTSSRDFSSLYGKEAVVSIDGDLKGFKLIDIKAK